VQQSLFASSGASPVVETARWIEGVLLGEVAVVVCVLAVACIGGLMLAGRILLRDGMRVVIGCFVLLGAPVIAAGIVEGGSEVIGMSARPPVVVQMEKMPRDLPPSNFDPYAGASLRKNEIDRTEPLSGHKER
jgi:type IV secretion system protein VirB2